MNINEKEYQNLEEQQKEILNEWVSKLEKRKTFPGFHNSYGLKHKFSRYAGFYITNDVMKQAMLLNGFKVEDTEPLHWRFNVSLKSLKEL